MWSKLFLTCKCNLPSNIFVNKQTKKFIDFIYLSTFLNVLLQKPLNASHLDCVDHNQQISKQREQMKK